MNASDKFDIFHQRGCHIAYHFWVGIGPYEELCRQGWCYDIAAGPVIGRILNRVSADVPISGDRRADVLLNSLFVNHRSIRQLAEALDLVLVEIDSDATSSVTADWI